MINNDFLQVGLHLAQSFPALLDDPSECFQSYDGLLDSDLEKDFPEVVEKMPVEMASSINEANCGVSWWIDDEMIDIPNIYEHTYFGEISWWLKSVCGNELDRQHFVSSKKWKSIKKETKTIWTNSFAFQRMSSIRNGNVYDAFLAVDISKGDELPVFILDAYRNSNCNGFLLSPRLDTFLDHWSRLAFVELSEKSLAPFTDNFTQPLNADCSFAKKWRKWLTTAGASAD